MKVFDDETRAIRDKFLEQMKPMADPTLLALAARLDRFLPHLRANDSFLRCDDPPLKSPVPVGEEAITPEEIEAAARHLRDYDALIHPKCLICGKAAPCMTEADLKPGDPGVPCTFDPTPRQLFDRCHQLEAELKALKAPQQDDMG